MSAVASEISSASSILQDYAVHDVFINSYETVKGFTESSDFLVSEVLSRITAAALPIMHMLTGVGCLISGSLINLYEKDFTFEMEHTLGGVYLKNGFFHLSQVIESIAHIIFPSRSSVFNRADVLAMLPSKAIFMSTGHNTRVGTNIDSYIRARWLHYKAGKAGHDVAFINREFNFSDKFAFSEIHPYSLPRPYSMPRDQGMRPFINFTCSDAVPGRVRSIDEDIYTEAELIEHFREHSGVVEVFRSGKSIPADRKDPEFRRIIQEEIALTENVPLHTPPDQSYSIALHVRDGGDFDSAEVRRQYPKKFPSRSYYEHTLLDCLNRGLEKVNNQQNDSNKIFIRIFTDALQPEEPRDHFERILEDWRRNHPGIRVDLALCDNQLESSLDPSLIDMYSMTKYDALIRPDSGLSRMAHWIKDYDREYYPSKGEQTDSGTAITEVAKVVQDPRRASGFRTDKIRGRRFELEV